MATLQHLPYLGTAEEDVLFVEWLVDEGGVVRAGQPLATVETLKAAFEVEAETGGTLLRQLCVAGTRVAVKTAIAVVGSAGEACDDAVVEALHGVADSANVPGAADSTPPRPSVQPQPFAAGAAVPVAPAARRRAAELGVDLVGITGSGPDGLVRVVDVERCHAARAASATVEVATPALDAEAGQVDAALLDFIRRDPAAFGRLPAAQKLSLYRGHGAVIGADCHLAAGVVLQLDRLVLGDGAYFGADTVIEGRELVAGKLLHFGARCRVRCTRVHCGDNAFFTDDIEIGGGGALEPEAELVVGSHGFVGEHVHLNPCRRLVIGDEVVVSRQVVVMTHSFGPSWLRGYPSRFAGVTVGDGGQLGIAAVVFPGVEIGAGAVVLSGSSVVTSVPPGRLFGGVPAVDLKAAAQSLTPGEVAERAGQLVVEFGRQLALRGFDVEPAPAADGAVTLRVVADDGEHCLTFASRPSLAAAGAVEEVVVGLAVDDAEFESAPPTMTVMALEPPRIRGPIGPLAAAFREFLRKRGVRLRPRGWAYTGGWL